MLIPLSLLLGYIVLNHMSFCRPFLGQSSADCDCPCWGLDTLGTMFFQSCWPHVPLCRLVFLGSMFLGSALGLGDKGSWGVAGQQ